jgi:hypothetical protein
MHFREELTRENDKKLLRWTPKKPSNAAQRREKAAVITQGKARE